MNYNHVMLIGRLTKEPEARTVTTAKGDITVANISVAVNRNDGSKKVDYINGNAFGKRADTIVKYLRKGSLIMLEGEWRTGSYEKDGKKVYTNELYITDFRFLESKKTEKKEEPEHYTADMDIPPEFA